MTKASDSLLDAFNRSETDSLPWTRIRRIGNR